MCINPQLDMAPNKYSSCSFFKSQKSAVPICLSLIKSFPDTDMPALGKNWLVTVLPRQTGLVVLGCI